MTDRSARAWWTNRWLRAAVVAVMLGAWPACNRHTVGPEEAAYAPLDFVLESVDGTEVSLADFRGRPLVINFWATWCTPCLKEIPMLKALKDERDDVEIVGIAIFDDRDRVANFAREMEFNYPALHGQTATADAVTAFGPIIQNLPFTLFAAPDGSMLGAHVGELTAENLENFAAVVDDLAANRIGLAEARARISGRM